MVTATSALKLDSHVMNFLSQPRKMLINGAWDDSASGKTFAVYDPATGVQDLGPEEC